MNPNEPGRHFDPEDQLGGTLELIGRLLFYSGILASAIPTALLVFTYSVFTRTTTASVDQARSNIELFGNIGIIGVVALTVGGCLLFWGSEVLTGALLASAAVLFFAPSYIPLIFRGGSSPVGAAATDAMVKMGGIVGVFSLMLLLVNVVIRIRERSQYGARMEHLKFGRGIKEERDIKNVFMGRCWQLPFCRKFVRERCPIFHAKRTCWRERVGCMCEEEVIAGAMANRPIPKDAVAAAAFIPRNNRLTGAQKFERCRQCVIYNEHQKHKYKLFLPVFIAAFVGVYFALRPVLVEFTNNILTSIDAAVRGATLGKSGNIAKSMENMPLPFSELLLVCFMFVGLAYSLKFLEFLMFKLKI